MSRVGIHTMEGNSTVYMPLAKIDYMEPGKKKKTVYLDDKMVSDKKYFKGWILGASYFVGVTADSYQIYDETETKQERHPSRSLEDRFKQTKMTSFA